jgi:hypothetical protein
MATCVWTRIYAGLRDEEDVYKRMKLEVSSKGLEAGLTMETSDRLMTLKMKTPKIRARTECSDPQHYRESR